MAETTLADEKALLRRRALVAARASAAAYGEEGGLRVAKAFLGAIPLPHGAVVSGYAPMKSEIDPGPLLTRLSRSGHSIALPFVEAADRPLRLKRWLPGEKLTAGQFGTRQPAHDAEDLTPDILIVPLVAFDSEGYRLGRGGGFYDRTIEELKARGPVLTVGLGFSAQNILRVPREPHDQRLDWIVTEEGALSCAP
ncbi:5-formyltetrahydrofolate cyclo-ligase [Alphaproteobacteria bacterium SO-S41]|nr:5-formyltetrahydrofolate cyclo-ligase [Alphaproteobacteria bacterium SO-S41]